MVERTSPPRRRMAVVLVLGLSGWAGCAQPASESGVVGLEGQAVSPFRDGAAATVLLFVRTDCPISNRYAPEVARIHERFAARGVDFWLVYPDPDEPVDAIREHVEDYAFPGRPIRDLRHTLVRRTGATVTPEAAVFDSSTELVYRGRIDDRYVDFGKARAAATTHDLIDALEATLDGRSVTRPRTRAVGCFIPELNGSTDDR